MAMNERLAHLLDEEGVSHRVVSHREMFTAQQVAAASHLSGRVLAKVVVLRDAGGEDLMLVVPASTRVDLGSVAGALGRVGLRLATEPEVARLFPDCETGAMPPFGHLYEMPVYLDACLEKVDEIYFQAGNHHEVVGMALSDYLRLARPIGGQLCFHGTAEARRSA